MTPEDTTRFLRAWADSVSLPVEEIEVLARVARIEGHSLGQVVFTRGDPAAALYLVVSGAVRLLVTDPSGRDVTVDRLEPGGTLGEGVSGATHETWTARIAAPGELIHLPAAVLGPIVERHPACAASLRQSTDRTLVSRIFRTHKSFSHLGKDAIDELSRDAVLVELPAGQKVTLPAQPAGASFLAADRLRVLDPGGKLVKWLEMGEILPQEERCVAAGDRSQRGLLVTREALGKALASGLSSSDAQRAASPRPESPPAEPLAEPLHAASAAAEPARDPVYKGKWFARYPFVRQQDSSDCAAACLAMICRSYGKKVRVSLLRDLLQVTTRGATLASFGSAAGRIGFSTRAVKASASALDGLRLPAIAHWQQSHYVVLYEVGPQRAVVGDPARGLLEVTRAEFEKEWTGRLLLLEAGPGIDRIKEFDSEWSRFLHLAWPYRWLFAQSLVCAFMLNAFGLALPFFSQVIIDQVLVFHSQHFLNVLLAAMIFVAFLQASTVGLRLYLASHIAVRLDLELLSTVMAHLLSLPMKFFMTRRVGDSTSRFVEAMKIRFFLSEKIVEVTLDGIMITLYSCLLFWFHPWMALLALAPIPVWIGLVILLTPRIRKRARRAFEEWSGSQSQLVEALTGIGTVKSASWETPVRWEWEAQYTRALGESLAGTHLRSTLTTFSQLLTAVSSSVLLWEGARMVMAGQLTVGQMVAFSAVAAQIYAPLTRLVAAWEFSQQVKIAADRLDDLLDAPTEEPGPVEELVWLRGLEGRIRFENVSFRYGDARTGGGVTDITLEVPAGSTVAVVGRSGSGKSTLASLILGLHRPDEGRILIDGHDLRHVAMASFRPRVGAVLQDTFLFSRTIRENICPGSLDSPMDAIVHAARLAGADRFIARLPLGYNTMVGERGVSLSGGERQRLAIARALHGDPRILILDEATSALDPEMEEIVQETLSTHAKGRTCVIISHRLATVRRADRILVMEDGNLAEHGTHEELLEKRGIYHGLCQATFQP